MASNQSGTLTHSFQTQTLQERKTMNMHVYVIIQWNWGSGLCSFVLRIDLYYMCNLHNYYLWVVILSSRRFKWMNQSYRNFIYLANIYVTTSTGSQYLYRNSEREVGIYLHVFTNFFCARSITKANTSLECIQLFIIL